MEATSMTNVIHIGIDVHKDSFSLCSFSFLTKRLFGQTKIASKASLVIKYVQRLQKEQPEREVLCGYEAGPTGFGLYRELEKIGIPCVLMAPTSLPKAPDNRVKTDRLDAQELAQHLAWGTYSAVHVPTSENEAVKDYTRMRNARVLALKKAKQNLLSFLLRTGRTFTEGKTYWTQIHFNWLRKQAFVDPLFQDTFKEYLQEVFDQQEKVDRYNSKIEEIANQDEYRERVSKLRCFRGIETHTALSLVAEIGDFSRFISPAQFSSFLGLVPSEESSGQRERRGGITKAGNTRLRLLLIEGAKASLRSGIYVKKPKRLQARQKGNDAEVIAYADRANRRLHRVYSNLTSRGVHNNKATVAVARELSCYIWGMMNNKIQ
ncbi:MAG: IS110 family transposase [Bacteroidia bacterium]|nr:IS110 family transposase [Bacteroidia bacterium]